MCIATGPLTVACKPTSGHITEFYSKTTVEDTTCLTAKTCRNLTGTNLKYASLLLWFSDTGKLMLLQKEYILHYLPDVKGIICNNDCLCRASPLETKIERLLGELQILFWLSFRPVPEDVSCVCYKELRAEYLNRSL